MVHRNVFLSGLATYSPDQVPEQKDTEMMSQDETYKYEHGFLGPKFYEWWIFELKINNITSNNRVFKKGSWKFGYFHTNTF